MKPIIIIAALYIGLIASLSAMEAPAIHSPAVYGVRPGAPVLFTIPATGARPMKFSAAGLPSTIHLDPDTGIKQH